MYQSKSRGKELKISCRMATLTDINYSIGVKAFESTTRDAKSWGVYELGNCRTGPVYLLSADSSSLMMCKKLRRVNFEGKHTIKGDSSSW
jgi:hypothetical protein